MKKLKDLKNIYFLIPVIFLFLLCLFIPYASDDWAWGSSEGIERLSNLFYGYNGRIVGNMLIIILSKSFILKTIIMFLVLVGIFLLIKFILEEKGIKNNFYFLISLILFLLMPNILFRQTVGWVSGFANYVFSTFTILLSIYLFICLFKNKIKENKKYIIAFLFLGLINSLVVEHVTIYNCIFAGGVLLYTFRKKYNFKRISVFYFIGSIVGALLMFLNPVYFDSNLSYKTVNSGNMIVNSINQYKDIFYPELFSNFMLLYIIISIILILIYLMNKKELSNKYLILKNISLFILIAFPIYNYLISIYPKFKLFLNEYTGYFNSLFSLLFVFSIISLVSILIKNKEKRNLILFFIISIIFVSLPLLIVSPVTSRCFFIDYIFLIIIILLLISYYFEIKNIKIDNEKQKILLLIFIIFALFYTAIFGKIFVKFVNREIYISSQIKEEKKEIEVIKLPFSEYFLWYSEPYNKLYEERFKDFYEINKNAKLKYID